MSRIFARNLSLATRASGAGRSHLDGNVPGPWKTVKFGAPEFSFEEEGNKMVQTATHPEKESKSLTDGGIPETFYDAKKSYQKSARSYAVHPGMEMEHNPVPKIRAFNRRILKVIEQMPEDYVYRTTVQGLIEEQAALVDQFEGDIALLEEKIGAPMEMHIRSLKRELRCARGLVEDQAWGELFASAPVDQWKWPI